MSDAAYESFVIETERLYLQFCNPSSSQHCSFMAQLVNSPTYRQWIGDVGVRTDEDAKELMQRKQLRHYTAHGFTSCFASLKSPISSSGDAEMIGTISLIVRDGHSYPDIGFAFLESAQGKGYAVEGARALMEYGAKYWNIPVFLGFTTSANVASRRVLNNLGLHELGVRQLEAFPEKDILVFATSDVHDIADCGLVLAGSTQSTFLA